MTKETTPLCIDCKHFRPADWGEHYKDRVWFATCAHINDLPHRAAWALKLVGITVEATESCWRERLPEGNCGPSGRHFEPSGKRYLPPVPWLKRLLQWFSQ